MADPLSQSKCAICDKTSTQRCLDCSQGLDSHGIQIPPVYLCSSQCKTAHQCACKEAQDLKQLYHAGDFVQAFFDQTRRQLFHCNVERSERKDGKTYVYVKGPGTARLFCDFSDAAFQGRPEDAKAVLANSQCTAAMVTMPPLVRSSLKGQSTSQEKGDEDTRKTDILAGAAEKIEDIFAVPKENQERIALMHSFNNQRASYPAPLHTMWRVTVAGKQYAFDLTSAQYSHFRTVTPWDEYFPSLCKNILEVPEFGEVARREQIKWQKSLTKWLGGPRTDDVPVKLSGLVDEAFRKCAEEVVDSWPQNGASALARQLRAYSGPTFNALLRKRLQEFTAEMQALDAKIDSCAGGVPEYFEIGRVWMPGGQVWRVR